MNCNFTYEHFEECIELGKKLGYTFHSMNDFLEKKPKNKFIIMRHDVDLSLKHALIMAEKEKSLGISSTYFIRITGIFNPFFEKNLDLIKKIHKLGHEIGLHYDFDDVSIDNFKSFFINQKKSFELFLKNKISGAALHKVKKIKNQDSIKLNLVEDFLNEVDLKYDAYSDIFMKHAKFISDSKFRWREVCMCNHMGKEGKLCILTHPIWWSSNTSSLVSIIEEIL